MPVVWVKFSPSIDTRKVTTGPLTNCPVCGGDQLQRWGKIETLKPNNGNFLRISRFRCMDCGRTFSDPVKTNCKQTHYETVQAVAGLIWVLGISSRDIKVLFHNLGLEVSHSSIWRCGKKLALKSGSHGNKDQRLDIDPVYIPGVSEKLGVVVGLELSDGRRVILGALPEYNPRIVKCCLEELLANANVEIEIRAENAIRSTEFDRETCPFVVY